MAKINHSSTVVFGLCLSTLLLSSCATIFKGEHAEIRVNSDPAGAHIFINEIDKGTTPQTLALDRDANYILTFKKEGYKEVKVEVSKDFDFATTVVGNLFSFFLIGVVVDLGTGAAYSLEPADIQANMEKMKAAGIIDEIPKQRKNEIMVIMLTQEEWEAVKGDK